MKVGKGGDLKKRALGVSAEGGSTGQRDANVDWQQSRSGGSFNKRSLSLSLCRWSASNKTRQTQPVVDSPDFEMSTTRCPGSAAHLGAASPPIWGWRRRHRTKSWYTWPSNRSRHFLTLFICLLCLVVIIIIYLFDVARVDVSLTTANYLAAPPEPSQTRTNTRVT